MSAPTSPDPKATRPPASVAVDEIHYRQLFPWLRMFDLFWISVDLQKLITAAMAVLLLWGGNWCLLQLPFATPEAVEPSPAPYSFGESDPAVVGPWRQAPEWGRPLKANFVSWTRGLMPMDAVTRPAQVVFRVDATWPQLALAWSQLLWALAVGALFGGAITRIAAVQIGTDRKTNLWDALKFSGRRFLSYFSAPLIPLSGIGVLWIFCLLAGLIGRIPEAGPWIVGAGWGVALLFGFLMALMLVGLAAGWPLMVATISVEGSDAPDGLTRSYGYVFTRPLYFAVLVIATALTGTVAAYLVAKLIELAAHLAAWGTAWGMGGDALPQNELALIWHAGLATVGVAFVHSYFWSAATMIYFALRRSVDANRFSEVYLEEDHRDEMLPWVLDGDVPSQNAEPETLALPQPDGDASQNAESTS